MRISGTRRPRRLLAVAAIAALSAITLSTISGNQVAQADDPLPGDGATSTTAGASCWGVKQQHPASATGIYWLNTVALERPQQFHCDMTTSGGGWVLVGRGRNGWTFNPLGQGSAATVRTNPDGPAAFGPAALSTATINALLNGTPVSSLADGVRLVRSTNTTGTARQQYTLFPKFRTWTWNFGAGQLLDKVVVGTQTYNGSNTYDTSVSVTGQTTNGLTNRQGTDRMFTFAWSSHQNQRGFSFGTGVNGGSNAATNHLWTAASEGRPLPFTQVWLRPQIANDAAGFTPLPAAGYPAQPKPVSLKNRSELAPWGVVGMDHTNETTIEPWKTNVLSLRTHGDRVFVGGRFTGVKQGPSGATTNQRYLAAFGLDGNWISTFRPTLDGRVWDMVVTADGKLIIAGDFTNVNGQPNTSGMAALDPATGAVIGSWKANTVMADGSRPLVRGLDVRDGWIYAVGRFNRVTGGAWNPITVTNAVSLRSSDGAPGLWRPRLSGSGVRIDVSQDATRVLIAGWFTNINGDTNHGRFGITDIATGRPVPGMGAWSPSIGSSATARYQQAVLDLGDDMVIGGSQHSIQLWNRNRTQMLDSHITKQGGDTQALELFDGKIYAGCHCGDYIYQGTNNFTNPANFRAVDPIRLVGAIDAATFEYDTEWYPSSLKGASGDGVWAIDRDVNACIWVGGDLDRGAYSGNAATDFLGGFARFCPADATPPTAPTNLRATTPSGGVALTWGASTDASGTVSYDIYRDDRPIATVFGTSFTDTTPAASSRYTVRAVDARGNRSASPAPITIAGPAPVIAAVVPFGSTWRHRADGIDQGTAWRAVSFDHSAWAAGPGKLGWGRPDVVTVIGPTKPLTSYFRTSFDVADPSSVRLIDLNLSVATGAVVYVNGVEAGRVNMAPGPVTASTPAAGYVSGAAETSLKLIAVPGTLLVAGTNSIAVEVHNMTPGGSRAFFDLEAVAYAATADTRPPSAPTLTARASSNAVNLSWTAATDDVALGGYVVERDGQPRAVVGAMATSFLDGEVDVNRPATYRVRAFDRNGNAIASNGVTVSSVANPNVLGYRSPWKWFYAEGGPGAAWQTEGFDDTTWASGPGELGYGDNDESTLISTAPTPRPLTAYFRTTVTIDNPTAFTTVLADLIRDDGAVLYINGIEVGRDNLPAGPIAFTTPALTTLSDRTTERTPVRFTIPAAAFKPGPNTIAVEIHNSDRWSGDLSMDLKLTGQP